MKNRTLILLISSLFVLSISLTAQLPKKEVDITGTIWTSERIYMGSIFFRFGENNKLYTSKNSFDLFENPHNAIWKIIGGESNTSILKINHFNNNYSFQELYVDNEKDRIINKYGGERMSLYKTSNNYERTRYVKNQKIMAESIKKARDEATKRYPNLFLPQDEFETSAEYNQRQHKQWDVIDKINIELENIEKERLAESIREEKKRIAQSLSKFNSRLAFLGRYNPDNQEFKIGIEIEGFEKRIIKISSLGASGSPVYSMPASPSESRKSQILGRVNGWIPFIEKVGEYFKIEYLSSFGYIYDMFADIDYEKFTYTIKIPRNEARSFKENYSSIIIEGHTQLTDDGKKYEYFNMVAINPSTGSRFPFGPQKNLENAPVIASKKAVIPPDLTMRVAFIEENSNGFLDAGEKGQVKVSIANNGKGPGIGVTVGLKADSKDPGVSFESSKLIGEILAGDTKSTEFEIRSSKSVSRMENQFTVSATESYGFPPDPVKISFETYPLIPPKLNLVDFGVSNAIGNNVIVPGVETTIQARVQNEGQGPAEGVEFSINLPEDVYFTPNSKNSYTFGFLKPNEFKDLEFSFIPNKTVSKTIAITIGFTVENSTESSSGSFPMNLEVKKPQKTIQQFVVTGQELAKVDILNVATISVDVEKDIPKTGRKGKYDLAVVFGIESYKKAPGVSFAKRDATYMKEYFEKVLGIPKNRIRFKTDTDVGKGEFDLVFSKGGWLDKRVKNNKTDLFIYYAGHGAPDLKQNKAYLIPYDGDPNYASQTGYEMDELYEQLGKMGAKSTTVFLDACFTGANRESETLLAGARPVFIEVDDTAAGNITVFSAAGGKEISSAWPEKKHGLFSYYLMKGMRGYADANKDKKITVGELGDYVKENVSDMAGMLDREQTPGLQTMDDKRVLIKY